MGRHRGVCTFLGSRLPWFLRIPINSHVNCTTSRRVAPYQRWLPELHHETSGLVCELLLRCNRSGYDAGEGALAMLFTTPQTLTSPASDADWGDDTCAYTHRENLPTLLFCCLALCLTAQLLARCHVFPVIMGSGALAKINFLPWTAFGRGTLSQQQKHN